MIRQDKMDAAKALVPLNVGKQPTEHTLWEQLHALDLNEEELIELCQWIAQIMLETRSVFAAIEEKTK